MSIAVRGAVQGVGFRPFVYRLATDLSLAGWVVNDTEGVAIEVEGPRPALDRFLARLTDERPPHARIHECAHRWLPPAGFAGFEIRHGAAGGEKTAVPLPELATCDECRAEVLDPSDRRHRYPFANCTRCGPRFTILRELPYDRPNTTMAGFTLCPDCRAEYESPADRRFHAQPIACPACGPKIALHDRAGSAVAGGDEALTRLAAAIRNGRVVAVKGLGGFHLICDAGNETAVARLRESKPRLAKPFAMMVADVDQARSLCDVSAEEAAALSSPEAPILLLPRRPNAPIARNVAPGHPALGVMLAYTPLHHLLLREVGRPIVATSGNLSDEPIAIENGEAMERLRPVADLFLLHDRPIERHMDDSVGWMIDGGFALLRRARGHAPLPVRVAREWPTVLAVGAHLKSAIALSLGRNVFVSQHIGDLETAEAVSAFERVAADFLRFYGAQPAAIAHDLHPDYVSTQWARRAVAEGLAPRAIAVQHHHAHLAACLAEHGHKGRALGVTWDGTGYGPDGTVWGGEFLVGDASGFERIAHLHPFGLPGGDAAVREPRRVALALLWSVGGIEDSAGSKAIASFASEERTVLLRMLERGIHTPRCTSAGRLFDGVAALIGLASITSYEGEAAAALEFASDPEERGAYEFPIRRTSGAPATVDWRPAVAALLSDRAGRVPVAAIAARFHNGLVDAIAEVARGSGEPRVVLTGGCFQNRRLTESAAARLRAAGHEVLLHRQVPPNDGGVSLGQAAVAAAILSH
ncbi:MAG: carbamoyltransferase HypF [Bacteroidota bacterium]